MTRLITAAPIYGAPAKAMYCAMHFYFISSHPYKDHRVNFLTTEMKKTGRKTFSVLLRVT